MKDSATVGIASCNLRLSKWQRRILLQRLGDSFVATHDKVIDVLRDALLNRRVAVTWQCGPTQICKDTGTLTAIEVRVGDSGLIRIVARVRLDTLHKSLSDTDNHLVVDTYFGSTLRPVVEFPDAPSLGGRTKSDEAL